MSGATDAGQGSVVEKMSPVEAVEELGAVERDAITAGDWDALEAILGRQKRLWRRLLKDARRDDESDACRDAIEALKALYEIRRHNHALIEQSFGELRRKLTVAHTGSGAKGAYDRTSGRAA